MIKHEVQGVHVVGHIQILARNRIGGRTMILAQTLLPKSV
jgi:hypothetical protein